MKKTGLFQIVTENTEYQMKVDKYGVLKHLWYGGKTGYDMEYMLNYPDVGFSGNIYDAGHDRAYSLDTLPLEYACEGVGDYRITAAAADYRLAENGKVYKGSALMNGGILLPKSWGDYAPVEMHFTVEV